MPHTGAVPQQPRAPADRVVSSTRRRSAGDEPTLYLSWCTEDVDVALALDLDGFGALARFRWGQSPLNPGMKQERPPRKSSPRSISRGAWCCCLIGNWRGLRLEWGEMLELIRSKRAEIERLCDRHSVRRLEVFGSASKGDFDPASSDLDFLVEFHPLPPAEHARCFFGLQEDFEALFHAPVELVEPAAISNPFFQQAIEPTRRLLYEAA